VSGYSLTWVTATGPVAVCWRGALPLHDVVDLVELRALPFRNLAVAQVFFGSPFPESGHVIRSKR
jgi:hypothetical protein